MFGADAVTLRFICQAQYVCVLAAEKDGCNDAHKCALNLVGIVILCLGCQEVLELFLCRIISKKIDDLGVGVLIV